MTKIFSDFEILALETKLETYGIHLKAKKPLVYIPRDLNSIALYSIILDKKTTSTPDPLKLSFTRKIKNFLHTTIVKLGSKFLKFLK